jgi:two-component system, cell cycle sensor histidine kinase and response regulator CckA
LEKFRHLRKIQEDAITAHMSDTKETNGTVLVIDDDPAIRNVLTHMLRRMGFGVLTAPDADIGVDIYRKQSNEIVAVVLDMIMLGMNSIDAFKEMQRINKDVRVFLSSGATDDVVESAFPAKGIAGFIRKPYQQSELTAAFEGIRRNDATT